MAVNEDQHQVASENAISSINSSYINDVSPAVPNLLPVVPIDTSLSQPLLYQRSYNPVMKKYIDDWVVCRCRPATLVPAEVRLSLELGGIVTIYPNLIDPDDRKLVADELLQYRVGSTSTNTTGNTHTNTNTLTSSQPNTTNKANLKSHLSLFRQYRVRGCDEPRWNCLLHTHATTESLSQPGYRYGSVTMKAQSYNNLPITKYFAKHMEILYHMSNNTTGNTSSTPIDPAVVLSSSTTTTAKDSVFNIGAHVLLYRDAHDQMGFHSDDDQGESYILTTILSQKHARDVIIKPKPCTCTADHESTRQVEMHYKLQLKEGDAYSMDGEMQIFYLHSIPKKSSHVKSADALLKKYQSTMENSNSTEPLMLYNHHHHQYQRLVIVFRRGTYKEYTKDSGVPVSYRALKQAPLQKFVNRSYTFGDIRNKLFEGHLYIRRQLFDMGAHKTCQRGVSGQKNIGCNAIIVSGLRHEQYSYDEFYTLVYCATTKEGGNSIVTSCIKNFPIRVFRSSRYNSRYRAIYFNNNQHKVPKNTVYRYDGLYKVVDVAVRQGTSSTTPVLACHMIKL